MKTKNKLLASVLCFVLVALCIVGMTACNSGDGECAHKWGEWSTTASATCTQAGSQERKCSECGETETSAIDALGHDWNEATCSTPKTCKTCSATEGTAADHAFTVETVKDEALKSAANCTGAAVYYKSCACGEISTSDADIFESGAALDHKDENKDHVCDNNCGKRDMGAHADENTDHSCDYGCADPIELCEDKDDDHACDYGCGKTFGTCEDADKDHDCDYGCGKTYGEHSDGDDKDHLCDYGCEKIADDGCEDTVVDGKCDECGADIDHTCVDLNKNHACDICSDTMGEHTDTDKDHACDYGCSEAIGDCKDSDKDHDCDYGCDKTYGEHSDGDDKDHLCDYGCEKIADEGCKDTVVDGKCDECGADIDHTCVDVNKNHACDICSDTMGEHEDKEKDHKCDYGCDEPCGDHADSATDKDHVCDYGCGAILEKCYDADGDGDHACDACGAADITKHSYSEATCAAPATCSECAATFGTTLEHKDDDLDHICNGGCGKNDMGEHADSADDNDHVCDYGCGAVLEDCRDADDDNDHACDVCGKADVSTHSFELVSTTPATCTSAAVNHYECNCGDKDESEDGDALGHNVSGVTPIEEWVSGCEYVLVYTCQREGCEAPTVYGETIYKHSHVASIERFATCKEDGLKTFKCACGDEKEPEIIPADATGHKWVNGEVVDGIRIDTCSECGETKTVTVYAGTKTDEINAGDLADKEIELNNANISLDSGVIDAIGDQKVTVSADKVEGDDRTDLGLSKDQLGQVGDNPIYNFTINNGTENISDFNGNWVTITLPYELSEGEDVDSIAIWFISDKCADENCTAGDDCTDVAHRLVSMFATYNDGYVTFKTNHFSYYTVTRLTPAERCALYGHGYAAQHVEGSCTKDAYDLYVCIRCHDKYIDEDSRVVADGHDYVAVEVPATCTARGSITYTCEDCGYHYTTKLNATGHAWRLEESKEASCVADGYVKYVCDKCGDEYSITYVKLAHKYTSSVIPATCTSDGYTLHACDNCNYSYTDSFVSALGHAYTAAGWSWSADYGFASLTFTCANDATHTVLADADIEKTVVNGTCSNFVRTTYTATVIYEGKSYTDTKVTESGTSEHIFSTEYKHDGESHWRECVCGEKTDVSLHVFENAKTTKEPTCTEAGESTSYCVCGETKVTVIPATGEHTYENGACTGCGKEENNCNHTKLHRESVDLGALGACDWVLNYFTCDCGEVKIIDTENSNVSCDMEMVEQDTNVDANGNGTAKAKGYCSDCGLTLEMHATQVVNGCTATVTQIYTFTLGDVVIFDKGGYEESRTDHGKEIRTPIDLSEYGVCAGTLYVDTCSDCGEVIGINELDSDCDIDLDMMPAGKDVDDENGITHTIYEMGCSKCSLLVCLDVWNEGPSDCERTTYYKATVSIGDTVIVQTLDKAHKEDHDYEYEYELQGDCCLDGVRTIATCSKCGDSYVSKDSHHADVEHDVVFDLSEYTSCGGKIMVDRCMACGYATYMYGSQLNCKLEDYTREDILDDNGQIIGYKYISICSDCGLEFVEAEWIEMHSTCEYTEYEAAYIYKNGELVCAYLDYERDDMHEYEYTYESDGDCSKEYKVCVRCTVCGYSDEWYRTGHSVEYFEIDLSALGCCGGTITGRRCVICETYTSFEQMHVKCENIQISHDRIVDENGAVHDMAIETCVDCGFRYVSDNVTVKENACITKVTQASSVYVGDECIVSYSQSYNNEYHRYEYSYEMEGESCNDSYKVIAHCTVCGKEDYWYGSGHRYEYFNMDMSELGCGGMISGERCDICGLVTYLDRLDIYCDASDATTETVVDEYGNAHYVTTAICPDCGLKYVSEQWTEMESVCVQINHQTMEIYSNDALIFNYHGTQREENHAYEITYKKDGETCDDGYSKTVYCPICGMLETYYGKGHDTTRIEKDLADYGLCGGTIREEYCPVCETVIDSYVNSRCEWSYAGEDDNGYKVHICNRCGAMQQAFRITGEKDDTCRVEITEIFIYSIRLEEIYRYENTYNRYDHNYTYEFVMYGDSCTDGYDVLTVCADCGDKQTSSNNTSHNTYRVFALDESIGCCEGHSVEVYSCPCGKSNYYSLNENTFSFNKRKNAYECTTCGLTVLSNTESEADGCTLNSVEYIAITFGDEEIYRFEHSAVYANHSFTKVETAVENGNTIIITSCDKCGEIVRTEILTVTLEVHEDGNYYCDYIFIPDEDGKYIVEGRDDRDTFVTLYQQVGNQLIEIDSNDDGGEGAQFKLETSLKAGETYVYRISFLNNSESGDISFTLSIAADTQVECDHRDQIDFALLSEGSISCKDGVLVGGIYVNCGCLGYTKTEYSHYTVEVERIDLAEHGACNGRVNYYSCPCGYESSLDYYDSCYTEWTSNEYYDEEGRLIHVETAHCDYCGLRYTNSYYSVRDRETCTITYYYTTVINVGGNLVLDVQYTNTNESHDYETFGTLINGEGSSCEDGVILTHKCKDCGYEYNYKITYHEDYELERIDLSKYGSVCGGYATVYGCACGEYRSLSLDHSLCDLGSKRCKIWIDNVLEGSQYVINGWNNFSYSAYIYTCAVTDPADRACGYKIRYAQYWLKDESSCLAYIYKTWQFGYDEATGTYEYEITFKTGDVMAYHNYVDSSTSRSTILDCPDCGSYYYDLYYYDSNDWCYKAEKRVLNNSNDKNDKYMEVVEEYAIDAGGSSYVAHLYQKNIDCYGQETWFEETRYQEPYAAPFGTEGTRETNTRTSSSGYSYTTERAYSWYKGYEFTFYSYHEENGNWQKHEYSYSFTNGCIRTTSYVDSDGGEWVEEEDFCKYYNYVTIQKPTCTQDGLECRECVICGKHTEPYTITPNDHSWVYISDGWYYCYVCGLENANGVSGDIIMEDLTDQYGNGEYYVVGYYNQNLVEFSQYISLILPSGEEVAIWSGIEFITIDGVRAFAFRKADVDQWAAANGYTDYDVRFSFVPVGSDGSFDYGITFTETIEINTIVGHTSFMDYIGVGETKTYTICPSESGKWEFTAFAAYDSYAELYDEDGMYLYGDDDSGRDANFSICYELEAGKTYTLEVRWLNSTQSGNIPLLFYPETY